MAQSSPRNAFVRNWHRIGDGDRKWFGHRIGARLMFEQREMERERHSVPVIPTPESALPRGTVIGNLSTVFGIARERHAPFCGTGTGSGSGSGSGSGTGTGTGSGTGNN